MSTAAMQTNFWEDSDAMSAVLFPARRQDALDRLTEFEKTASRYSRDRNLVVPRHENVSRLSAAIGHRLITEEEVAKYMLNRYAFSTVDKFLQELYWRRYWKGWLARRPEVWGSYVTDLEGLVPCELAQRVMRAEGDVEIMNHFARELIETGYMHNHARMWFAGYWVHQLKLPWQLGADFFYRHLLDADPASNTLSWRWVAGLQTAGKTYIARRANIEKYVHEDILLGRESGLERLEGDEVVRLVDEFSADFQSQRLASGSCLDPSLATGLWIHEEDLSCEYPTDLQPARVLITEDRATAVRVGFSQVKRDWIATAIADCESRARDVYAVPVKYQTYEDLSGALIDWMAEAQLSQLVTYRPEEGYLNDQLMGASVKLEAAGYKLILLEREQDVKLRPMAERGFFGFWKKAEPLVRSLAP
jgi:deoxyribodipyrimidine photo-lyase